MCGELNNLRFVGSLTRCLLNPWMAPIVDQGTWLIRCSSLRVVTSSAVGQCRRCVVKVLAFVLALVNFESQLNESDVLQELFSDCVVIMMS